MALNASEGVPGTAQEAVERYRKVVKGGHGRTGVDHAQASGDRSVANPERGAHVPRRATRWKRCVRGCRRQGVK